MNALDWCIIVAYLAAMIGFSVYLGRGQQNQEDYYLGGRNLPWWAVGISTMATQTSAISFISIPAFVALKPGGGMTWLQYELAVPLAMIFIMVFLIPFFRKLELVSVYEYLEHRYGPAVRTFVSAVFLISRGLGTGAGVYASAIVLSICLDIPLWATILIIGVVTVIYDSIGGMTAVVYSDVIQMVVLLGGLVLCIGFAVSRVGSLDAVFDALEPARWQTMDMSSGLGDASGAPFWAFLIGGFFLYCSYYGTDQSQVQRELSAPTLDDTKRSLIFNGLARFPLTLLYIFLGLAVGAVYVHSDELRALVPAGRLDYLVPQFILLELPQGVRAILFAAMLSAAMSSLDSALNSLSAATMRDFVERGRQLSDRQLLRYGKITTVIWGAVITGSAFLMQNIGTVIEAINKIGSAFYGPILAAFLVGVISRRANGLGVIVGVLVGVSFNVALWLTDAPVYWMWWNAFGFVITAVVTVVVSLFSAAPSEEQKEHYTIKTEGLIERERSWLWVYGLLAGYFVLMIIVMAGISSLGE